MKTHRSADLRTYSKHRTPNTMRLMSPTDQTRTKSAYGLQWNRFRIIRPEEDRVTFRNRTGLDDR